MRFAQLGSVVFVVAEVPETGTSGTTLEEACIEPHWSIVLSGTLDVVRSDGPTARVRAGQAFHVPAGVPAHSFQADGRISAAGFAPLPSGPIDHAARYTPPRASFRWCRSGAPRRRRTRPNRAGRSTTMSPSRRGPGLARRDVHLSRNRPERCPRSAVRRGPATMATVGWPGSHEDPVTLREYLPMTSPAAGRVPERPGPRRGAAAPRAGPAAAGGSRGGPRRSGGRRAWARGDRQPRPPGCRRSG